MRYLARSLMSLAVVTTLTAFSSIASADALPPDAEGCLQKSTGDTCMTSTGASGTCSPQQQPASPSCTFFAMEAGTDAEACSQIVQICEAGGDAGKQPGGTGDGGGTSTGDGGTTPSSNSTSKSGCSTTGMEASDVARAGAPFLIAALVPLVLRSKRKRKTDRA
jgi:hypothetical protein